MTKRHRRRKVQEKRCAHCDEVKSASEFHKAKNTVDKLASWCKDCARAYSREHYHAHKKARIASDRRYKHTFMGWLNNVAARHAVRAKAAGVESTLTGQELYEKLVETKSHCVYCGDKLTRQYGPRELNWDHVIPMAKGGNNDAPNVVPSCQRCNSDKGERTPDEWTNRWYDQGE